MPAPKGLRDRVEQVSADQKQLRSDVTTALRKHTSAIERLAEAVEEFNERLDRALAQGAEAETQTGQS